jgi:hypothetical protein
MQYFSILEQSTKEASRVFAEKRNIIEYQPEDYRHPQEDYLLASVSPPIFVVADGVTLNFKKIIFENKARYPNPSPAGEVAKIFCKAVVEIARTKYNEIDINKITEVFREANNEVKNYNQRVGESDICGNITGFFAATGAFVIIKNDKAYWASICDSFVAHFDQEMNLKFMSSGVCTPYAVINGEERMVEYLKKGFFDIKSGDRIFVFTDGFEYYVKNSDFLNFFKNWDNGLYESIAEFSIKMNLQDPEKYGKERSLIAILV